MNLGQRNQRGFSLIEILMVMVILGIIGGITLHVLSAGVETYVVAGERKELYDEARIALERMVREIRDAGSITSPAADDTPATSITFIKANGSPGDPSTTITFQQTGANLERVGDISGTDILASNLIAGTGFQATHESKTLVMVTDTGNMTDGGGDWDASKRTIFQGFGYSLTAISDNAPLATFTAAAANNEVMFISESVLSGAMGTKARGLTIGVVNEEQALIDELELVNAQLTAAANDDEINIVDNSHYITSLFGTGNMFVYTVNDSVWYTNGAVAPGVQLLGTEPGTGNPGFLAADTGALLDGGFVAPARRVSPFFMHESAPPLTRWTAGMNTLMKRSLDWAAGRLSGDYVTLQLTVSSTVGGTITLRTRAYTRNFSP